MANNTEISIERRLDGLNEEEVLAVVLSYTTGKVSAASAAKMLFHHFGNLSAVFDATPEELMRVEGITKDDTVFLKMIPPLIREYMISKIPKDFIVKNSYDAGKYLLPFFCGDMKETFYMLFLEENGKVIECRKMFSGDINSASLDVRSIVIAALGSGAHSAIMAHNHPTGFALPSKEDRDTTKKIYAALKAIGVELLDHLIIADEDFVSLADDGYFKQNKKSE